MSYSLPSDVDERPIAIAGAGTLGRRIAAVYAAGGSDVRIFDPSADQRTAAVDFVNEHADEITHTLDLEPSRAGHIVAAEDLNSAVRGAWMVIEAVPEKSSSSGPCSPKWTSSRHPTRSSRATHHRSRPAD